MGNGLTGAQCTYAGKTRRLVAGHLFHFSRPTRLSDLLFLRAPGLDFLLQGPPADLSQRLEAFARKADVCRAKARDIVRDLKLEDFLH